MIALLVYGGLMGLTYLGFQAVPIGFIPDQDKGYLVVNAQLPDGASLERSDRIIKQMSAIARNAEKVPGVWHTIDLPGYSALLGTNISNVGGMFVILEPFEERKGDPQRSATAIAAKLRQQYRDIRGGADRRLRRAGDRRPGHHRRLQAPGPRPARGRPPRPASGRAEPGGPGQRGPAAGRLVQQLHGRTNPSSSWRSTATRSRRMKVSLERRQSHAAGISRRPVRQRRYAVQSKLASKRPGRRPLPYARGGHRPAGGPQRRRPASALADPGQHQGHQRAGDRQPLQHLPLRRGDRKHGPGHQLRPGDRHHGPTVEGVASRRPWGPSGRSSRCNRSSPARISSPSWLSRWRWSSCSWCCRLSMRAGPCRCRSFSSSPCACWRRSRGSGSSGSTTTSSPRSAWSCWSAWPPRTPS